LHIKNFKGLSDYSPSIEKLSGQPEPLLHELTPTITAKAIKHTKNRFKFDLFIEFIILFINDMQDNIITCHNQIAILRKITINFSENL